MKTIHLPPNLNLSTIGSVIKQAPTKDLYLDRKVLIDGSNLQFIDPAGAAGLGSFTHYLRGINVNVTFNSKNSSSPPIKYLDDSGFFECIFDRKINDNSNPRGTTVPFLNFTNTEYIRYLYRELMPWIAMEVDLSSDTLSTIRTCLEEAFHNVEYHSGVQSGLTLSQHYPQKKIIKFALSDHGRGIPALVRTVRNFESDSRCIKEACQEGFSTQSNVRNRGAGLAILINYVTIRNGGIVQIRSMNGYLEARAYNNKVQYTTKDMEWSYPGTMVHVILQTNTLETFDEDIEQEVFTW